jgi:hypothetical protein
MFLQHERLGGAQVPGAMLVLVSIGIQQAPGGTPLAHRRTDKEL